MSTNLQGATVEALTCYANEGSQIVLNRKQDGVPVPWGALIAAKMQIRQVNPAGPVLMELTLNEGITVAGSALTIDLPANNYNGYRGAGFYRVSVQLPDSDSLTTVLTGTYTIWP